MFTINRVSRYTKVITIPIRILNLKSLTLNLAVIAMSHYKKSPPLSTKRQRIEQITIKLKSVQCTSKTEQNHNQKTIWGKNPMKFWTYFEYNLRRLNNFVLCKWSASFSELMKPKKFCNSFRRHHRSDVHSIIWQVANILNTIVSII